MNGRSMPLILLLAGLAACSEDPDTITGPPLPADSIPGVYAGVLPCEDCPGIDMTLWLRADGRYFLSRHYRPGDDAAAYEAHSLGSWRPAAAIDTLELSGAGPAQQLRRMDVDQLELLSAYEPRPVLGRDAARPQFTSEIGLDGVLRVSGNDAQITECITGLQAPLAGGGEKRALLHRYRAAVGSGEAATVRLSGQFTWHADGSPRSLVVARVLSLSPGGRCSERRN